VTPRLVFRRQAEAELLDARDWYDDQRTELGGIFATEVDRALRGIVEAPLAYPLVQGEMRSYDAFRMRSTSRRCPMRSSYWPSFMVDGTHDAGSRGADVEPRSRADCGLACAPRNFGST